MTKITIDRALVEQALEALTNCNSEHGHRCNRCDSEVDEGGNVATALRVALAASVPHGYHVDLEEDMKPDGCVLDDGRPENCIYAKRLLREGKDKTACEYWQPIEVEEMTTIILPRAIVEQTLEALEEYEQQHGVPDDMMVAITALRAAQGKQE